MIAGIRNTAVLVLLGLFLTGCSGVNLPMGSVIKPSVAALAGYAAWELAPDDWRNSEKAALAAGTAAASWILGELVDRKIDKDKLEAYEAGYSSGRAYGARRQYDIIQQLQRSNYPGGRVRSIELPAPAIPGVKQMPHMVSLEVLE